MPRWTFQQGTNNKWWGYDLKGGTSVTVKWGRIGREGQSKEYGFGSSSERDSWLNKKVREQERDGYRAESDESLAVKSEVAQVLGTRNTIIRVEFVRREDHTLKIIGTYEPTQFVYCEVLDSYSSNKDKKTTRVLLSKDQSFIVEGTAEESREIECDTIREVSKTDQLVRGVREYLKRLAQKVEVAARRMIGLGERKLKLGLEGEEEFVRTESVSIGDEVYKEVESEGGASRQVVSQMVGLGMRKLML